LDEIPLRFLRKALQAKLNSSHTCKPVPSALQVMVIVGRASSQELVPTAALLFHAHAFLAPSRSSSANETGGVRPPRTSFRREIQPGAMRRWPLQADEMAAFAVRASDDVLGGGFGFRRFRSIYRNFRPIFEKNPQILKNFNQLSTGFIGFR
jgi:hypothetical protein